jgi:hypothetical protein
VGLWGAEQAWNLEFVFGHFRSSLFLIVHLNQFVNVLLVEMPSTHVNRSSLSLSFSSFSITCQRSLHSHSTSAPSSAHFLTPYLTCGALPVFKMSVHCIPNVDSSEPSSSTGSFAFVFLLFNDATVNKTRESVGERTKGKERKANKYWK